MGPKTHKRTAHLFPHPGDVVAGLRALDALGHGGAAGVRGAGAVDDVDEHVRVAEVVEEAVALAQTAARAGHEARHVLEQQRRSDSPSAEWVMCKRPAPSVIS